MRRFKESAELHSDDQKRHILHFGPHDTGDNKTPKGTEVLLACGQVIKSYCDHG